MIGRADHRIDNLVELIRDLLTLARSEQAPEGEEPELVPVAPSWTRSWSSPASAAPSAASP